MVERLCVFISYKRQDQPFAERLWEKLIAWGHEPWLDVKNIPSGISPDSDGWRDAIHKGLKRCHVLIGVVTPESLNSKWVKREWSWADQNNRRILLLQLRPFDQEDMPPEFVGAQLIDVGADEQRGLDRLHSDLQDVQREREALRTEITPPPLPPLTPKSPSASATDQPKAIPPYLLQKPARRRHAPWRLTLRTVGILALPVSFLWLLTQPDFEPLLALLGAIATILASFVGADGEEGDLRPSSKLSEVEQMRRRVYQYWVQGVMQTALKEVKDVGIALDMQPEAVVRDTRKNVGDITLPNDSRHVRQVYDIFKSFLVLGDPGAGKTIMLLQLAESLILDPPPTHKDAIPLVLNLSSWALHPRPLHEWLEEEVWRTYRVRGNRVRGWLQNNQLILLLDGLDEVKEEKRAACVDAINDFRKRYAFVPLVVCSRIREYDRLGETKLELPGAILLEALSKTQIDHYLSEPSLAHLKRVIAEDPVMKEMATTPFLLNTMIYAYRHEPEAALRGFDTAAQRREHLFNTYVQRRLKDNPSPYSYQQTIAYLQWLATKMQAYVQTVFHLEDIQPNWVADDPLYSKLINGMRIGYAVILTLVFALVGWQMSEWIGLLAWGAAGALVGGIIANVQQFRLRPREQIDLDLDSDDRNLLLYVTIAIPLGLTLTSFLTSMMAEPVAMLLVSAAAGILAYLFFFRDSVYDRSDLLLYAGGSLGGSLGVGAIAWSIAHNLEWSIWVEAALVAVITVGVLMHGFLFEVQDRAQLSSPMATPVRVVFVSVAIGVFFGLIGAALNLGAAPGIAAGLTYAGLFNALTLINLPVLWLRMVQRKSLPFHAPRFLDALSERQILRRMGGGYIFIHRYLLENFARLDEIYVLLEQLEDAGRRNNAMEHLRRLLDNASVTTQRTLTAALAWDNRDVHPLQRHFGVMILRDHDVVPEDSRPGVALRPDGLPDIDWCDTIAPGSFLYGNDKQPATIDRAYQISRYPVTNAQFQTFLDDTATGYNLHDWWTDAGWERKGERTAPDEHSDPTFRLPNHPRIYVRWYEVVAFCNWLTWRLHPEVWEPIRTSWRTLALHEISGLIRLPTEKEWERAARGTDGRQYPWGEDWEPTRCNNSVIKPSIGSTSAVGIFPQGVSPCGAHDMAGNVWEWCLTQYMSKSDDVNGTDVRVLRGGSWDSSSSDNFRCATRVRNNANYGDLFRGFRLVLSR